jgi:hypothetical protein
MQRRFTVLTAGWFFVSCAAGRVAPPPRPPEYAPPPAAQPATLADAAVPSVSTSAADAARAAPSPAPAEPKQETPSSTPVEQAAPQTPPTKPERPPLGWIAGQPLQAEEFLVEWGDAASRELWLVLDKLVASRLALAEAGRLSIRLAPEAVEGRFTAERGRLEKELARDKKERTLEEFIEKELGFEPKRYLERVRQATIRQMLAERAVRAASLASESVALRLIVVPDDEAAEKVRAALASGKAFADVARELSLDDSKKNGGLVPFVVKEERSPLARLAFQTAVGEVAGPAPVADHQFWIRVEERRTPLEGDWPVIEKAVEDSLVQNPVGDAEFVHWKVLTERRYPIDFGPLWSLIGAAR